MDLFFLENLFPGLFSLIQLVFTIAAMVYFRLLFWLDFFGSVPRWNFYLLRLSFLFIYWIRQVTLGLYFSGCKSQNKGSSLKPHTSGNLIDDWWFGIQLNPQFMGIDLKFFFVRAGMMGWLLINLSVLAKTIRSNSNDNTLIRFNLWDIIAERLGFMLVFGDLVWIPFTFSIQGRWLLRNNVELTMAAAVANCFVFLIGYLNHNLQNSPVPYFYPIYLLTLLIWRERRDEARCAEKYKDIWLEHRKLVPWRILPYVY